MRVMLLCSLLLIFKQCDLASPDKIKEQANETLRPYFQNVKTLVLPDQHTVLALTCMQGAGPKLLKDIAGNLTHNPGIDQLKMSPLAGGARYDYFALGFDTGLIWLDIKTKKLRTSDPWDGYNELYRHE